MRPMTDVRARRAIALTGTLAIAAPLAITPAVAKPDSPSPATAPAAPTATAAAAPATPTTLRIRKVRRTVLLGRRALVTGTILPGGARRTVRLQARIGGHWRTVDRARTRRSGLFRLRFTPRRAGSMPLRVRTGGASGADHARRTLGRVNVFRRAFASWYGPGLYGGHLACGGTLSPGTLGVANKTLPCGTKVTLRYHGHTVRVPVVDRGPYVAGRDFDLTPATKQRLGFGSTGVVLSTR